MGQVLIFLLFGCVLGWWRRRVAGSVGGRIMASSMGLNWLSVKKVTHLPSHSPQIRNVGEYIVDAENNWIKSNENNWIKSNEKGWKLHCDLSFCWKKKWQRFRVSYPLKMRFWYLYSTLWAAVHSETHDIRKPMISHSFQCEWDLALRLLINGVW